MRKLLGRLVADSSGATAVEYAFMAALIAAAIVTAVSLLGGNVRGLFERQGLGDALG